MPIEMFYRMRSSALTEEVEELGTVADILARWHTDPWYDGPKIDVLLHEHGATQTYYGALGGFDGQALGIPERLVERLAAIRRERGPWPNHADEPEVLQDLMGVVWVSHEELLTAHRRVATEARQRFAYTAGYADDPDRWLEDLAPWLEPVGRDDIEVWVFEVVEPKDGPRGRPHEVPRAADTSDEDEPLPEPIGWVLLPWAMLVSWIVIVVFVVFR